MCSYLFEMFRSCYGLVSLCEWLSSAKISVFGADPKTKMATNAEQKFNMGLHGKTY